MKKKEKSLIGFYEVLATLETTKRNLLNEKGSNKYLIRALAEKQTKTKRAISEISDLIYRYKSEIKELEDENLKIRPLYAGVLIREPNITRKINVYVMARCL